MAAEEREGGEGEGIPRSLLSYFNVIGMNDLAMKRSQLILLTSILRSPPSCGSTLKTLAACCYLRSYGALHLVVRLFKRSQLVLLPAILSSPPSVV